MKDGGFTRLFGKDVACYVSTKIRERIGVDVGINTLATCSDGTVFPNLKPYRKAKRRLAHLQRAVSRKINGSANRFKTIKRLARQHWRVANIRLDGLHKLTRHG